MALIPPPTLVLDFAGAPGFLSSALSFSRSTTGSYVDHLGVIRYAPINAPRWTYDPDTGESRGIMVEPSRTNRLLWSEDQSNVAWTKTNLTVTSNAIAAPDGATTADLLTVNAASGNTSQAVTITAADELAVSVYAKPGASNFLHMQVTDGTNTVTVWFNLSTGAVGTNTAGGSTCAFSNAKIKRHALSGWYRCNLVLTTATNTSYTVKFSAAAADNTAPANTNSVYVWGAQAENASNTGVTSYIPTTSATVARTAESLIAATAAWINGFGNEGTILIESSMMYSPRPVNNYQFVLSQGGASDEIFFNVASGGTPQVGLRTTAAGNTASISLGAAVTEDQVFKAAIAYKDNNTQGARDGVQGTQDTACSVPTALTAAGTKFGSRATGSFAAAWAFRRFLYWPRRLGNSDLQALTA